MSIWGNIVNFGKKIVDDIEGNNNGGNPSPVVQSPQNLPILGFKPTPTSIPGNPMGAPGFNLTPNLNPNSSTNIGSNLGTLNVPGIKLGNPSFTPNQPTPQVQPVHNNFFSPILHQLNQAGNGAISDLKDFGDLGALGMANLTGNQQAANNARNAIGNNNANLGTKNFATNLGGLSQDVGVTPAAKAFINTSSGIATGLVNKATGQNLTSQQAIGGGPLGGLTNWASNNGTINEGTGRNLAGNAINTAVNLLTLGKGKAIEQVGERGVAALLPKLAESGLGRAAQRLAGSEALAGLYGAGQGASQAAQSANNIKEGLTDVGKGVVQNLPFGALGVLPNATHGLINTANKVADSTPAIINQTRKSMTNQIGRIGINNVADNHPAVIQLNNHLDNLNKLRDGMTQSGLDERNPAMVNNAKAYQATLDELNNTRNAITQGGYAKVPGTPEPTPETPQAGNIDKVQQIYNASKNMPDKDIADTLMGLTGYENTPTYQAIKKLADERLTPVPSSKMIVGSKEWNDYQTQRSEREEAEAASKATEQATKRNDLQGFTDNKSALQKGKIAKMLDAKVRYNGVVMRKREYVQQLVKDGATIKDGILFNPDGQMPMLNKTEQDYAKHLLDNSAPQAGNIEAPQPIKISKPKTGDDLSNPQNYADAFGITKQQAEQDFKKMREEDLTPPNNLINNEPPKLTVQQKREIIQENPYQKTKNQVELNPQESNVKGAIAQATGKAAERDKRLLDAEKLVNKLTPEDKELLYRYDDGEKLPNVLKDAKEPAKLEQAIKANDDAFDYHLSLDRAAGGSTLRQNNYTFPKYYQLPDEQMDALGIPENQRYTNGEYRGFHDTSSKYKSYLDAERQAGLKPLYDNPADAIKTYRETGSRSLRNQALFTALSKAAPLDVADLGITHDSEGRRFSQAAGNLPFSVTDDLQNRLKAFRQAYKPETKAGQLALQAGEKVGIASKGMTFLLSPVHYANVGTNFFGATAITGHGFTLGKGFGGGIVSISNKGYGMMLDHYKANGTLDWAINAGLKLSGRGALGRYTDSLGLALADLARKNGIDSTSQQGVDLAAEYNKVMGHKNYTVEGTSPNTLAVARNTFLAQNWTPSQLAILKDAGIKWENNSRGIGLLNPGDTARSAVFGKRLTEATAAIIISAIATGQAPHLKDLINEAGFNPNNPVPNIQTNTKDSKGRKWVIDMPTDPIGLAAGLVTDPKHFLQSRESPLLGIGTRLVTNQNWNGQPIADMSQPGAWPKRIEGAFKGALPISLQNATNPSLSIKQGFLQDIGFRYKSDPNDPQNVATKQHFDQQAQIENLIKSGKWSQIPGSNLQDVSPQEGLRTFNDQYARANVAATKDQSGNIIPGNWNALSGEQKASFYLQNDQKTGAQMLSPTFFAAQSLALKQPDRPHSPLFDLTGNDGKNFTLDDKGNIVGTQTVPRAQIALDYQAQPATSDMKALILAANPWLTDYEKQAGDYAQNYHQNMTSYMQQQGWTPKAINNYWTQHPSNTPPIAPPPISPQVQSLKDQYNNIKDPTEKAQFFLDNSKELSQAFTADAIYKNQKAVAEGALPAQMYPVPNVNAAAGLAQLQKNPNHDKTISAQNGALIKSNPDLNQYLADTGLYTTAKDLALYQYQDPTHPGLNASQLINLDRPIDQSTLKGISNLASYDIGKNANGQYSFMQNGSLGNGFTLAGSGGSSNKYHKIKKTRTVRIRQHRIKMKVHNQHLRYSMPKQRALRIAKSAKIKPVRIKM